MTGSGAHDVEVNRLLMNQQLEATRTTVAKTAKAHNEARAIEQRRELAARDAAVQELQVACEQASAERDEALARLSTMQRELRATCEVCEGLRRQVRQGEQRLFTSRMLARSVSAMREQRIQAQLSSLEVTNETERAQSAATHRQTLATLSMSQQAEAAALRAQHTALRRVAAATLVQAVERQRRARAEMHAKRLEGRMEDVTRLAQVSMEAAATAVHLERAMSSTASNMQGNGGGAGEAMTVMNKDGRWRPLREGFLLILRRIERDAIGATARGPGRYMSDSISTLVTGRPETAALGLAAYLQACALAQAHLTPSRIVSSL